MAEWLRDATINKQQRQREKEKEKEEDDFASVRDYLWIFRFFLVTLTGKVERFES